MKYKNILCVIAMAMCCSVEGTWNRERVEGFLSGSSRFVESDCDDADADDIPNRSLDALPLFDDVVRENGWSTNDLVLALIDVASNGLATSSWTSQERVRATVVAFKQLANINHPYVTNYFNSVVTQDLHGLESVAIPALFKYTYLEPSVMARLYELCVITNRYDKAAPMVALDMQDCLGSMPEPEKSAAKLRVAMFKYYSLRHISSSQTWQDEDLAVLIPSYSNSIQRLRLMQYVARTATSSYERNKAQQQLDRLNALPTNNLSNVSWIENH